MCFHIQRCSTFYFEIKLKSKHHLFLFPFPCNIYPKKEIDTFLEFIELSVWHMTCLALQYKLDEKDRTMRLFSFNNEDTSWQILHSWTWSATSEPLSNKGLFSCLCFWQGCCMLKKKPLTLSCFLSVVLNSHWTVTFTLRYDTHDKTMTYEYHYTPNILFFLLNKLPHKLTQADHPDYDVSQRQTPLSFQTERGVSVLSPSSAEVS